MVSYSREKPGSEVDAADQSPYLNRELSTLQFNERVLELAEDRALPLLERAKFLAIVASNMDEFYMVRVAGIKRQQSAGLQTPSADGLTPSQQLQMINGYSSGLSERCCALANIDLLPGLFSEGIKVRRWAQLSDSQREELETVFTDRIFPILTPLAVDPGHPFPHISNRSLNLAVFIHDDAEDKTHFARVKVPPLLPRLLAVNGDCYVPIEDVIAANLGELFPGMRILESHVFRVTRDAELEVDDDDAEDLLEALEEELTRRRFSKATRLEIERGVPEHLREMLMRELQVGPGDVFEIDGLLDLTALFELQAIDRPDLKDAAFVPANPPALVTPDDNQPDIFAVLRGTDVLVHHPYESFANSVQMFIEQAAADPDVLAIKQTLYRTSGQSAIVDALIEAAEEGKQVVVLVEIKARFDEVNNINWARTLEQAGCHVVYGLVGLKTHCKLCLVVRKEGDRVRRYVHVGTGNYNPATARIYEDIGLLTSDEELGADVGSLFNYLTGHSRQESYDSMMVAPHEMRDGIIALIRRETENARAGIHGRIVFKLNSLVDERVIDALYEASQAGVPIDVIARGICSLRPGVPGMSENIRVRSILGRFLEHSRMYWFANSGDPELYFGSADMMHRNLDRRVEVLARVESEPLKSRLREALELALADNTGAWELASNGEWTRVKPEPDAAERSLQKELMERASLAK